ncbi:MAG: hypothetical protein R3B81_06605 [bacterium]
MNGRHVLLGLLSFVLAGCSDDTPDRQGAVVSDAVAAGAITPTKGETHPSPARSLREEDPARDRAFVYVPESPGALFPGLTSVVISSRRDESTRATWMQWAPMRGAEPFFTAAVLVPDSIPLFREFDDTLVARYVFTDRSGDPIEYVESSGRRPALPLLRESLEWIPRGEGAEGQPARLRWSGHVFRLTDTTTVAASAPAETLVLRLDERLLVGTSRDFKDDGTGRTGDPLPRGGRDYRWVPLDQRDYDEMIEAGMNLFRVPTEHLDLLITRPVYVVHWESLPTRPELLWRGNYFGPVMYMDEPIIRMFADRSFQDAVSPSRVADEIQDVTRERFLGDSGYGGRFAKRMLEKGGCSLGTCDLLQSDYPVWEAAIDGVWYVCAANPGGVCYQGRFRPEEFADRVERVTGVSFPRDPRSCILLHYAFLRGAARWHGVPWGISIYGQMEGAAADQAFDLAWERGARYFWVWTSDGDHHVERSRQIELVSSFRDDRARTSPPGRPATSAIVVPWGYAVGEYALLPARGGGEPEMWQGRNFRLGAKNDRGVAYGAVLRTFYATAKKLLEAREEFDVLSLRDGETAAGYEHVYLVREDATLETRTLSP